MAGLTRCFRAVVARPAVRGYKIEEAGLPKGQVVNPDKAWANTKTYFKANAGGIAGSVPLSLFSLILTGIHVGMCCHAPHSLLTMLSLNICAPECWVNASPSPTKLVFSCLLWPPCRAGGCFAPSRPLSRCRRPRMSLSLRALCASARLICDRAAACPNPAFVHTCVSCCPWFAAP